MKMTSQPNIPNWLENQFDQAITTVHSTSFDQLEKRIATCDIKDRYSDKRFVAMGGMKTISQVHDRITGRSVAMAELRDPFDSVARELFIREVQLNAILQHPNILQIYDFGFNTANNPYFTMKLLQGKTLKKYLFSSNLKRDRNRLLSKFIAICEAVAFAHSQGIMHLDLKPQNIWIGGFDETLVMDWGLARIFESTCDERLLDTEVSSLTSATVYGIVRGTPGYMSPEQANKKSAITYRSDIFSLGAILYRLLTGQTPFRGRTSNEVISKTQTCSFTQPSALSSTLNIPDSLEAIVIKAMEKDPANRYDSAGELANDIKAYLSGFAPSAENAGIFKQLTLQYKRNKKTYNLILLFLLLISTVTGVSVNIIKTRTEMAGRHKATAKSITEKLHKEQKENERLVNMVAHELFLNGKDYLRKGLLAESLATFKEALKLGENTPEVHYYLSGLYIYIGELKEVRKHLENVQKKSISETSISYEATTVLQIFKACFPLNDFTLDNIIQFNYKLRKMRLSFHAGLVEKYISNSPMTLDSKTSYIDGLLRSINNKYELNISITQMDEGVKVDLSNNGSKPIWGYAVHLLPVIELDISNTFFKLSSVRSFPFLKKVNLRGSKFKNLSFFGEAPLEEVYVSENFKDSFKDLIKFKSLKKIHVPKSFMEQASVVRALKKRVKIIFE